MEIYFDSSFLGYSHSPSHPESPSRLGHFVSLAKAMNLPFRFSKPSIATIEQLCKVHSEQYVRAIERRQISWMDDETPVHGGTFAVASLSAGAAIDSLRNATHNRTISIALARPPGHHAGKTQGGGFCYFNNVAVAIENSNVNRVAIVDMDVHHGNGTSEIFYDRDDVLYISTHQKNIYPGTGKASEVGAKAGLGYNVNIPLKAGSGDATFNEVFERIIIPILLDFRPQSLLVSLGVDAHYLDPLASLDLTTSGYLHCLESLIHIGVPTSVVLEGGYSPSAIADVLAGFISARLGLRYTPQFDESNDVTLVGLADVQSAYECICDFWHI